MKAGALLQPAKNDTMPLTQAQQDLKKALAKEKLESRSALAQKMCREMSAEDKLTYKKLNHAKKNEFRLKWASKKLEQMTHAVEKEDAWRTAWGLKSHAGAQFEI